MNELICVIEGDGIGREVTPVAMEALQAVAPDLEFVPAEAGWECFQQGRAAIPDETWRAIEASDAVLFGAITAPAESVPGYQAVVLTLRKELGLFANLRPVVSPPVAGLRRGVDLLIVRENTEDLYVGRERSDGETAVAERVISRSASERIARLACGLALARRRNVTVVHKANVLPQTCGLFRSASLRVALAFPEVTMEEMLVDAMAMWLAKAPERFDVVLTPNMFGDILSDEASVWCGGLGMAPSLNLGENTALAEPVHGSAPDIASKGIANPMGAVLSGAMLLRFHLGREEEARRVEQAVWATLSAGYRTPDLPGDRPPVRTEKLGSHLLERLREKAWA